MQFIHAIEPFIRETNFVFAHLEVTTAQCQQVSHVQEPESRCRDKQVRDSLFDHETFPALIFFRTYPSLSPKKL